MSEVTYLENSKIIQLGTGSPIISIVGLVHGNEPCGGLALDELINVRPNGTLRLVYANLEAQRQNVRGIDSNLNRVFPGDKQGDLEQRTAFQLRHYLDDCDFVLDIHSTSYKSEPFAISTIDSLAFDELATSTGLGKYTIMTGQMANGGSLIDYVNANGGKGISFEAGTHNDESSIATARQVINNFLGYLDVISQRPQRTEIDKFYATEVIRPGVDFVPYLLENFQFLGAGTPYGEKDGSKLSLGYDSYPFLVTADMVDGKFFIASTKQKPL